ncbi:DUF6892 domain-containing protein [Hymenobacter cellulosilyticus]|uniref:DUF6892 domain-containing protein n=1 Tax=Hymenobacter cellulosilyticus TaxID=2932248 RepID=A0A8T9PZX8_9BACT|nr:hypothetical protein [Hymenobacter cellulosilyticus]UOQ70754.1 hypothetical protein MUN79_18935 [Hymenobacter cellulosilyticus]
MDKPTQFQDFNFKLAVIQVLMYEQELLQPAFSLRAFAKTYQGRRIDIEKDGYDIIPEVRDYFLALEIPAALLTQVEEIYQDGGDDIYHHLYPFWDGEDETFTITSTADLALLPNLRKMTLFYDDREEMIAQFQAQGIETDYC